MSPDFILRLKFGAAAWNHWRREEPDLAVVLDEAKLDGAILTGVNFSGVSLRRASLHATNPAATTSTSSRRIAPPRLVM